VALQHRQGVGQLTFKVSRCHTTRHTHTHTHTAELLWTSDQLVAEAATYTRHNKDKTRKSVTLAGFETAIPVIERLQAYVLAGTATEIGLDIRTYFCQFCRRNILISQPLSLHGKNKYVRSLSLFRVCLPLCPSTVHTGTTVRHCCHREFPCLTTLAWYYSLEYPILLNVRPQFQQHKQIDGVFWF
jgi:hypothetical protein